MRGWWLSFVFGFAAIVAAIGIGVRGHTAVAWGFMGLALLFGLAGFWLMSRPRLDAKGSRAPLTFAAIIVASCTIMVTLIWLTRPSATEEPAPAAGDLPPRERGTIRLQSCHIDAAGNCACIDVRAQPAKVPKDVCEAVAKGSIPE